MLKITNIEIVYNDVILAVRGISLEVPQGGIVALLGSNGAGKSTTLKAISGVLDNEEGEIVDGKIEFKDILLNGKDSKQIVQLGIVQVPEGRRVFDELTADENLWVGAYHRKDSKKVKEDYQKVMAYFPFLMERRKQLAGYLSGGEQQMLVIGRAIMAHPELLMLDEPSLGLAPLIVENIFQIIQRINEEERTSILLVEQNANIALQVARYGYIMENGKVVLDGPNQKLAVNEDVKEFYLGLTNVGARRSYRDVKHYKRRKRWLS
jgi:branched-chain amino acid transport system ATP-binding protein